MQKKGHIPVGNVLRIILCRSCFYSFYSHTQQRGLSGRGSISYIVSPKLLGRRKQYCACPANPSCRSKGDNLARLRSIKMTETQGPFEFRRMISWQLSQVQEQLESYSTSHKKQKRRKHKLSDKTDGDSLEIIPKQPDTTDSWDESKHHDTTGYLVVNSDGEEEMFYSAPESPVTSEDEENMSDELSGIAIKLPQSESTKNRYIIDTIDVEMRLCTYGVNLKELLSRISHLQCNIKLCVLIFCNIIMCTGLIYL